MPLQEMYDVFISFRGVDTREGFASHLYAALSQKKIATFIDDRLEKGGEIPSELLKAIEQSRVSIVIFSENYASSSCCLKELQHIMEWKKTIIPVFYNIDPSDVRKQKGNYAAALLKLEEHYGKDNVDAWRASLTEAANRSGFHSYQVRPESKLVKEIVQDVLKKLKQACPSDLNLQGFVGLDEQIEKTKSLLQTSSKDVRILGILGMPGIGKTTLAGIIFHQLSPQFEHCCFVRNVREKSENHGHNYTRNKLCSDLLHEENMSTTSPFLEPFVTSRLCQKKVLLVLDDVSDPVQLGFLGGEICFDAGSRIIVTTRDKHVLTGIKANEMAILTHEVQKLCRDDALVLLHFHAFRRNSPTTEYKKLSARVINYAQGNPLALKILGSHVCDRSKKIWESTLSKLEAIIDKDIQKVLKISYDDLHDNEKNIFLDLACFFKGEDVNYVKIILDGCGFLLDVGLELLIEKSLITISSNRIWMHDMVQQMGREVVRQQSKRTRLWRSDEVFCILENDIGTEDIEGIFLNVSGLQRPLHLKSTAFSKMYKLRLLKVYRSDHKAKKCKVYVPSDLQSLPGTLRYLHWEEWPFKTLPLDFPENLAVLNLPNSQIEKLWIESKACFNVVTEILKTVGFSCFSGREEKEVMPTREDPFRKLVSLDLHNCKALKNLPSNTDTMVSLLYLNLSGCSCLNYKFRQLPRNITKLNLSDTAIEVVPESIEELSDLKFLYLSNCKRLHTIPTNICQLKRLKKLSLLGCTKLKTFPEIFQPMENLELLSLAKSGIEELPWQIEYLIGLRELYLERCKCLVRLPESIKQLHRLRLLYLPHCESLKSLPELPSSPLQIAAHHCTSLETVPRSTIAMTDKGPLYKEVFGFYNCAKLDQNAINNIMADSLLKIYRETSKARMNWGDKELTRTLMYAEYPGNQFPEWIEGQTVGNSIHIKLPPNCSYSHLLGFVVCAHVVVNNYFEHLALLRWDYNFQTSNGWSDPLSDFLTFWSTRFDHVFIASYTIRSLCEFHDDISEIKVDFSIFEEKADISEHYEVKKCGIKCVYAEEVDEFMANNEKVWKQV